MPSRYSDRGRMLAKALREDPEFEQAKMMAEFSEPYGTAAAVSRIAEGDADWLDYAAAVPVLGLPARYANRFKSIEKAAEAAKAHKSKEVLTEMDIDDFLSLAEQGHDAQKAERLVGVEQFDDVPYLKFSPDGDVAWALADRIVALVADPIRLQDMADTARENLSRLSRESNGFTVCEEIYGAVAGGD